MERIGTLLYRRFIEGGETRRSMVKMTPSSPPSPWKEFHFYFFFFAGNIVLTHPTSIRRLFTNELNGVSPTDYLTIGTDQQIDSNIVISRMHVNDIQSNVINNMQRFAEYVAVIGRNNVVDSEYP